MKVLQKYKDYLFEGEWHIHTNFTDGENSILEYTEKAIELGIPLLAFTEHVRKKLDYDFGQFLNEVNIARKKYPNLVILAGCESKVLEDGTLDCREDIFEKVDYRIFAFHSFPESLDKYLIALENVLINYDVDAWAHPGLFFKKHNKVLLSGEKLSRLFRMMAKAQILLEVNLKYKLPDIIWLTEYTREAIHPPVVFGGDVHNITDLYLSWKVKQDWKISSMKLMGHSQDDAPAFMDWFMGRYPDELRLIDFS